MKLMTSFWCYILQTFSLLVAFIAICLEVSAHDEDNSYESREKRSLSHNHADHSGILKNEEYTRNLYFTSSHRDLWHEPLAITFMVTSIFICCSYIFLATQDEAIADSVFLCGVINVVQIYLYATSAVLIFKSYILYDNAFFESFKKGVKIAYFGLAVDGYMRLSCYDGYFTQNSKLLDPHYDENWLAVIEKGTEGFRRNHSICQYGSQKLTAIVLLCMSVIVSFVTIVLSVCCDVSTIYGPHSSDTNRVYPQLLRAEGFYNKQDLKITETVKGGQVDVIQEYSEEQEEMAVNTVNADDDEFMAIAEGEVEVGEDDVIPDQYHQSTSQEP